MIRVLLADDQAVVRAGLRALLERSDDITVVGEAVDGGEALVLAHAERPDVVLMDVRMPGVDGIEATSSSPSVWERPASCSRTSAPMSCGRAFGWWPPATRSCLRQ